MNKLNHVAIATLVALFHLAGMFWYSDIMFGGTWLSAVGKTSENFDPADPVPYAVSILATIFLGYFITWLLRETNTQSMKKGGLIGAALGFVIAGAISMHYLFLQLNWTAILIDGSTTVLSTTVAGAILSVWRKV